VLSESLQGGKVNIESHTSLLESEPASSGLKTVLLTQRVGSAVYFDVAGFPGRTVGLNAH
jgi:hypothetical protein